MNNPEVVNKLRPYQKTAFDFMTAQKDYIMLANSKGTALQYDDMGLGKTFTTLCCVEALNAFPCIIVAPKFALLVWQDEIQKWLGKYAVIYSGKPKDRMSQWKEFITMGDKFLVTNYALLPEIAIRSGIKLDNARTSVCEPGNFKWGAIIWDEAHMGGLFNHKTASYKVSLKLAREIPTRYVLTGTPFRQGCVDLYGPLSLLDPVKFNSYWKFVNKYCTIIETAFGKEIERNPSNLEGFRALLKQYMVRRLKEDVLLELPGKQRQSLFVEMLPQQQKLYDELTEQLIAEVPDSEELLITPNQMTLMMRQRQILACPQVLGLKVRGAAIDAIMEHSHLSMDDEKPIVIFTPFRSSIEFVAQALQEEYPGIELYIIQGKMSAEEFGASWMGFQNSKNPKRALLCVIKSGASFHSTAASTAYFLGYEWDFNFNEQCEDRLNRMGQKDFVNIYYVMTKGTVDENVAAKLNDKKSSSNWVVGTDKQYMAMLKQLNRPKTR